MLTPIHETIMRFFRAAWSLFLTGLFTILPIVLTIVIFNFTFNQIKKWLAPLQRLDLPYLKAIPHYEIFLALAIILAIGAILQIFFLRTLINYLESFILRIPLVRPIYGGIKQLVNAFSSQDKVTFKQVVMLEFPLEGVYSIGFLSGEMPPSLTPHTNIKYFNVFVPTTPNPTTGFFIIVPENKIQITQLNRQEAMALIISGGIICPDRFTVHK